MNSVDLIVLAVVVLNGALGAFRGFTWQVFRLGSLVLAFWLGSHYAVQLADGPLARLGWDDSARRVLAWVGIFVLTYLVMTFLGHKLRKLIDKARLTSSDRSLGFLLGSLKGVVFVAIALQILIMFHPVLPADVSHQIWGDPTEGRPPSQAARLHHRFLRGMLNDLIPSEMEAKALRSLGD